MPGRPITAPKTTTSCWTPTEEGTASRESRGWPAAGTPESTFYGDFTLGFPREGHWHEIFNSDHYDHYPNPWTAGNGGGILADGGPVHGMPHSARITVPANSLVVFATDLGD